MAMMRTKQLLISKLLQSRLGSLIVLLFLISACSQGVGIPPSPIGKNSISEPNQPSFAQFQDIPIPSGAEMNLDRTVILGAPESWIGRLTLESGNNPAEMFDFFKQRTPEFGWQEVTTIRSATSHLVYTRSTRVLNIQIVGKTLRGSVIVLTVSPKGPLQGATSNSSISGAPNIMTAPLSKQFIPPPLNR